MKHDSTIHLEATPAGARQVTAVLAVSGISDASLNILPLILGNLIVIFGISQGLAGFVIFTELAAMTLTTFVLSPTLHRLNRRTIGVSGAMLICIANLTAFASSTAMVLFFARLLSGVGNGAIASATTAVASEHKNSHRLFVALSGISMLISIGMFMLIPRLAAAQGPRAVFVMMAIFAAIGTVLALWLPKWTSQVTDAEKGIDAATHRFTLFELPSFLLCGVCMLFFLAMNGAYFYAERIGSSIGMKQSEIGDGLALAAFISLLGPVLASALGVRFGRIGPIIAAVALNAAGVLITTHTTSAAIFIASITLSTVMLTFAPPYILGLAASLVSSGRLACAARGAFALGSTITPAISALILMQGGSYKTIGWVAGVCSLVAIGMMIALRPFAKDKPEHGTPLSP